MSDIDDLLSKIRREQEEAGEHVRDPASPEEMSGLRRYMQQIGTRMPDEYAGLLAVRNGLDFNGYLVFGASTLPSPYLPSFTEVNEMLARTPRRHAFYGQSSDELYAEDLTNARWQVLDRVSLSVLQEFASCTLLLAHVLQEAFA